MSRDRWAHAGEEGTGSDYSKPYCVLGSLIWTLTWQAATSVHVLINAWPTESAAKKIQASGTLQDPGSLGV